MKKLVHTIIVLIIFVHFANSQNVVNSGGGNISNTNSGGINYSIGNTLYSHEKNNAISFSEGVQHAIEIIEIFSSSKLSQLSVYPNPTTDFVVIDFGNFKGLMKYNITTIEGKILTEKRVNITIETIQMQSLSAGTYFLNIEHNGTLIRTFKIIKL